MPGAAIIFNRDLVILRQNAAHAQMTGTQPHDVEGKGMFEAFPAPPDPEARSAEKAIRESTERVYATGEQDSLPIQEHALKSASGRWMSRFWDVTHAPIKHEGEVVAILQFATDVTDRVLSRRIDEARRIAAQNAAGLSFFTYDLSTGEFTRTSTVDELFGLTAETAGPKADAFFARIYQEDMPAVQAELERIEAAPLGTQAKFDYRILIPETGETRFVRARGAVEYDPYLLSPKLVGVFIDMTDVARTKARLEQTIEDKENLLLEVNHRVKNSLQLVTSVLRMEARRVEDPHVSQVLSVAQSRVEAIAEVHRGLYVGGDVKTVSARALIENLVESTRRSIGAGDTATDIDWHADEFSLPTELGIAYGLLVNELLTNAVKYGGAPDQRPITVRSEFDGDTVRLTVSNDLSDEVSVAPGTGVGTQLVNGFVRQLKGELSKSVTSDRFDVSFVAPRPRPASN